MIGYTFTTDIAVGNIKSGRVINEDDKIKDIMIDMLSKYGRYYNPMNIGTWNTISDVDTFFALHNHNNNWDRLKLGNYIRINDGTYNVDWEIAGFDMESNRLASDNTTYDNGYGICLIPKTSIGVTMKWNNTNTVTGGYKSSTMHTSNLVTVANNLKNVLGNHLVLRNVLLSSSVDSSSYSNAYTWTTSYATLMSGAQLTGSLASHSNKYDDGEANYKLPLFDYEEYKTGSNFWLRGVWGYVSSYYGAWYVFSDGSISGDRVTLTRDVRPLIYLR